MRDDTTPCTIFCVFDVWRHSILLFANIRRLCISISHYAKKYSYMLAHGCWAVIDLFPFIVFRCKLNARTKSIHIDTLILKLATNDQNRICERNNKKYIWMNKNCQTSEIVLIWIWMSEPFRRVSLRMVLVSAIRLSLDRMRWLKLIFANYNSFIRAFLWFVVVVWCGVCNWRCA